MLKLHILKEAVFLSILRDTIAEYLIMTKRVLIYSYTNLPEEKRTVLLLRTSANLLKAKGSKGTILGEMLNDLGCIYIADSDKTLLDNLSVESVIRQEPYRIFAVAMGDDTAAQKNLSKTMEENPAWEKLDAVSKNRLHIMDRKLFNLKPNANWAKAYEQLVEILLSEQQKN